MARPHDLTTVWLGEVRVIGYDLVIVARSEQEAKRKMLAEQRSRHKDDGYAAKSWEELCENTEVSLRELPIGQVVWP